jgi:uncharacterized membrane protein
VARSRTKRPVLDGLVWAVFAVLFIGAAFLVHVFVALLVILVVLAVLLGIVLRVIRRPPPPPAR